ncbi:MAG: hypothetical protein JOZ89_10435 [Gammaproteobacteria bacterium]|nr:hypothetical protein [Gammaproteobacteria bacterium]
MTAVLGTLPFLATLWLLVVLGAAVVEESGAKIVSALKGEPKPPQSNGAVTIRLRRRERIETTSRCASVQWRAAA